MKAEYEIRTGHVLDELAKMEPESVNCVVTSPPYWGQRDYADVPDTEWSDGWVGQFGHEPTPEQYVEHTLDVLRGVRRVLRSDGVVWWNIGDSYTGLRPKELVLLPARVALALQADGWYVRSDIIWRKTDAMPESVKDRPTKAHEHILMLTKNVRYWYDYVAVMTDGHFLRNVWSFATANEPKAHFAVFPLELPKRCILASCPLEVCAYCGYARKRLIETSGHYGDRADVSVYTGAAYQTAQSAPRGSHKNFGKSIVNTIGWSSCDCAEPEYRSGLVLDPFAGIGTTLSVAQELGRDSIGIEISPKYVKMAKKKIKEAARAR